MGHLLSYSFLRLSVASIVIQEFLFVHSLSFLSTRSASGFLLQAKKNAPTVTMAGAFFDNYFFVFLFS